MVAETPTYRAVSGGDDQTLLGFREETTKVKVENQSKVPISK